MDEAIKMDYGFIRFATNINRPLLWLMRGLEKILPDDNETDGFCSVMKFLWVLFVFLPAIIAAGILSLLTFPFLVAFYFILTVYMDTIFLLFTVLIAYYQVPRRAFYGYLSASILGLFLTWLNCDPTHYSKLVALEVLFRLRLKPLIRLLDVFGKFRSSCPVDGLPQEAKEVMIFSRTPLLIKQIVSRSILDKDAPDQFYHYEGVFEIVPNRDGTLATIMFCTKFSYFMREFDYDENRLGVVSRVFKLMFQERIPIGMFFTHCHGDRASGEVEFQHMSPGAIINKVMSGEDSEVHVCKIDENVTVIVF